MSCIAASLLFALAIRPAPQVVERIVERIAAPPAAPPAAPQEASAVIAQENVGPDSAIDSSAMVSALPNWPAWGLFPQAAVSTRHEPFYPELRNRVLLHGLGSWTPPASASAAVGRAQEEPISSREQLERWLEQEGADGAARRLSRPALQNPSGARS
jgi:hypothetical protein